MCACDGANQRCHEPTAGGGGGGGGGGGYILLSPLGDQGSNKNISPAAI